MQGDEVMANKNGTPFQMTCVIHRGNESSDYVVDFNRKRAALLRETLETLDEAELNELLMMLEEMKKNRI